MRAKYARVHHGCPVRTRVLDHPPARPPTASRTMFFNMPGIGHASNLSSVNTHEIYIIYIYMYTYKTLHVFDRYVTELIDGIDLIYIYIYIYRLSSTDKRGIFSNLAAALE